MIRSLPPRFFAALSACCTLNACASVAPTASPASQTRAYTGPTSAIVATQEAAVHVLNRLTFGPRPGDVERVLKTGIERWIDQHFTRSR